MFFSHGLAMIVVCLVFFFKHKTAYEMRISDWSSDVCSSDLHLDVLVPGDLGQLAQRLQLGELRGVVGVGDGAGTQAVAQREADVVGPHDVADLLEMIVEEALPVMGEAPLRHDRAAAADDADRKSTRLNSSH